jgi:hypothetical protein
MRTIGVALALLLIGFARAGADTTTPSAPMGADPYADDKWHWSATPYLWLPTINGSFDVQAPDISGGGALLLDTLHVQMGPNQLLTHLNFASQLTADVHKGQYGAFIDFITLNLSSAANRVTSISGPLGHIVIPININTSAQIASTIFEVAPTVNMWHRENSNMDGFIGYRSANIHGSTTWNLMGPNGLITPNGSSAGGRTLNDFLVGVRGRVGLGHSRWFVPYYLDAGLGSDNTTWQGVAGVGYGSASAFSLVYRTLHYEPGDGFLKKLRLDGPALAYTFQL